MENEEVILTDEQAMQLAQFSYVDLTDYNINKHMKEGDTIESIYEDIIRIGFYDINNVSKIEGEGENVEGNEFFLETEKKYYPFAENGGLTHKAFLELLESMANDPVLGQMVITAYENDNRQYNPADGTGFKAYAFEYEGQSFFSFTGSEGASQQSYEGTLSPFLTEDWQDNLNMGLESQSDQFDQVQAFVEANMIGDSAFVTGHSKGAANALYACAAVDGVTGKVFDGQGIDQIIDEEQRARLQESGAINYVAEGDIVGVMMFHRELVVYVDVLEAPDVVIYEKDGSVMDFNYDSPLNYHYPQVIRFDDAGNCIDGERTQISHMVDSLVKTACLRFENEEDLSVFVNSVMDILQNDHTFPAYLALADLTADFLFSMATISVADIDLTIDDWWMAYQTAKNENRADNYNVTTMDALSQVYTDNYYETVELSYLESNALATGLLALHQTIEWQLDLLNTSIPMLTMTWEGFASEAFTERFRALMDESVMVLNRISDRYETLKLYIEQQHDLDQGGWSLRNHLKLDLDICGYLDTEMTYEVGALETANSQLSSIGGSLGSSYYGNDVLEEMNKIQDKINELKALTDKVKNHNMEGVALDNDFLSKVLEG